MKKQAVKAAWGLWLLALATYVAGTLWFRIDPNPHPLEIQFMSYVTTLGAAATISLFIVALIVSGFYLLSPTKEEAP